MVVQIGPGAGEILSISPQGIEFSDDHGKKHFIDLTRTHLTPSQRKSRYIGQRKLDAPPLWVEIRGVRFVFSSYEAAYKKLMGGLREHGLRTVDLT